MSNEVALMPHDREAEQRVLGALLIDRDAIFKVVDILEVDDFYIAAHQRIYSSITALLERQEQIDTVTVSSELLRRGALPNVDPTQVLTQFTETVSTAMEIERDSQVVKERSLSRRLFQAADGIARDVYADPADVSAIVDRSEQRIFELRDQSRQTQLRHIRHALIENFDKVSYRASHPFELSGIASGFPEIDRYTEGFERGDLVILAARPAVGKTSLALAIAEHASRHGRTTLVVSLEMDSKQVVARLLGLTGQTNLLGLRTGADVLDTGAADRLSKLPLFIDDTPGISIMELRTKARRISAQHGLQLLVVDYLQLIRADSHEENRVQEISTITRNLKALARELNIVVLALSQLSRAAGDGGTEPKLATLRESGSIEQDADIVLMLWRPKEVAAGDAPLVVKGSIAKNRNGPIGQFELYFEGERARFYSRADDSGIPM